MAVFTDFEILVGTYEEYVIGYKLVPQIKPSINYDLVQNFVVKAHLGPVRCITTGSKYAISGGSDEQCKIFDLDKRVEHGALTHHEGTVSCVATHGPTAHLLTASDDNSISVVRMGSWQVEKTLYKHSAGVTALALHPSGKLAFSAAKDKKMITWNLVKARPAFISHIKGIAEMIVVSPDGTRYAVGLHRRIDIYSIENAGVEYTIDLKSRPNCLVFLSNDTVVVGGESPTAEIHSLIEKKQIMSWKCHDTRVRVMTKITSTAHPDTCLLVTASSNDHMIKLWDVSQVETGQVDCIGEIDTTCRVTSIAVWHPDMTKRGSKKKRKLVKEGETATPESPKKKIKITEEVKDESVPDKITVEEEENVAGIVKGVKKKMKRKSKSVE